MTIKKSLFICFISMFLMTTVLYGQNIEKLAKKCEEGNTKACEEIIMIAKTHKKYDVRIAAVEKLNDQSILAEIAKKNEYSEVRVAAIKKIDNEALIAEIANKDEDKRVRLAAVGNLNDQSILSKIAKTNSYKDVAGSALEKVTDQQLIAEIVKPEMHVQTEGDSQETTIIAIVTQHDEIRADALNRLQDQGLIAEIAKIKLGMGFKEYIKYELNGIPIHNFRDLAVLKLKNKTLLTELADTTSDIRVQMFAIISLALGSSGWPYGTFIQGQGFDQGQERRNTRLAQLANSDPLIRKSVVEDIDNEDLLALIAIKDREQRVREAAKKRLEEIRKKQ